MKKIFRIPVSLLLGALCAALPLSVDAQSAAPYQFSTNGIAGCNQTSAAASSVGAFSASGSYVPVADSAVELNTGYLVYLACSLNPLMSALSGSATAGLAATTLTAYTTGNNGNPQFSVNINNEINALGKTTVVNVLQGGALSTVNPAFQSAVQTAVAQNYYSSTQQPSAALACPYTGDLTALENGQAFSWAGLGDLTYYPSCNALGAYQLSNNLVNGYVANAIQNNLTQLQWGRGTYPITATDQYGNVNVVTPGAIVLNQAEQALQAGFTKTQDATGIGQMVGALFAGLGAEALTSAQGLAGIAQSQAGQPPYLQQVSSAASQGAATSFTNAAITELNGILTTATNYANTLSTIDNTFVGAINSLENTENQCWNHIVSDVCVASTTAMTAGIETCKDASGDSLTIATSTQFSATVIDSQIVPAATIAEQNYQSAQTSLATINQLIAGVTSASPQAALQQLDQLTASNSFTTPADVSNAQQESAAVTQQMTTLVTVTVPNDWEGIDSTGAQSIPWGGNPNDPSTGWCNYNNPQTLSAWEQHWKQ